jgi:hypothetical protein
VTTAELTELRTRRTALQAERARLTAMGDGATTTLSEAMMNPSHRHRRLDEIEEHVAVLDRMINQAEKGTE